MAEFTFLTKKEIEELDILKKYGKIALITDFSILLGGYVSTNEHTDEGNTLKDRTGWWWTKTPYNNNVRAVHDYGISYWDNVERRSGGARPASKFSKIQSSSSNVVRGIYRIKEVTYGEYPQTIASIDISNELEKLYNNSKLNKTGKNYTTDSVKYNEYSTSFKERKFIEYEYKGKKYIRFIGDQNCKGKLLSDGRKVEIGKPYWIEVEPITWLVDEKKDIALCKKIIFSGVQFNNKENYQGDFDKTDISRFMNKTFAKDIMPSNAIINENNSISKPEEKSELQIIIEEIYESVKETPYKDEVLFEINKIVDEYNANLDKLKYNKNNIFLGDYDSVTKDTKVKLLVLKDEYKMRLAKKTEYLDTINYINECLDILKSNNDTEDELQLALKNIVDISRNYLNDEDYYNSLISILNKELEDIKKYIMNDDIKLEYKNKNEFIIYIRKILHPILLSLNDDVQRKIVNKDIEDALGQIKENKFQNNAHNSLISLYTNELNNIYKDLKNKIGIIDVEQERNEFEVNLESIIKYDLNNEDLVGSVNNVADKLKDIYKLQMEVDEYIEFNKKIDNSYLSNIKM